MEKIIKFSKTATHFYFDSSFKKLSLIVDKKSTILITDENIFKYHQQKYKGYNTIILKPGESYKTQSTVNLIIKRLIEMKADRSSVLVGVGGGVITDLTGYIASIYMRGISFGFIPTTILGLVDASIGGKNGIDIGNYKNIVGTIIQPQFILHDISLLNSLPQKEWVNGFAEIIKHACIKDKNMFYQLKNNPLSIYQKNKRKLISLIQENVLIKTKVVQKDEFEKGERRLLNLGHTLGHALEKQYRLMHGEAVSIGIVYACRISEKITKFTRTAEVTDLLKQYQLPVSYDFNKKKTFEILKMDKKRVKKEINFVLLNKIGQATVKTIELKQLEKTILDL